MRRHIAGTKTSSNQIQVNRRAMARIRSGHPWIYRSDLLSDENPAEPGALVRVVDERFRFLGTALYSSTSQIALRMIAFEELSEGDLPELVSRRIAAAI